MNNENFLNQENISLNPNVSMNFDDKQPSGIVEENNFNYLKFIEEMKQKYKMNFIFDLSNLILSIISCVLYIISTYSACSYHQSKSYLLFNFLTRVYFLVDFTILWISSKAKTKLSDYVYITIELMSFAPYLIARLFVKFEEDYTNKYFILTNSLI